MQTVKNLFRLVVGRIIGHLIFFSKKDTTVAMSHAHSSVLLDGTLTPITN